MMNRKGYFMKKFVFVLILCFGGIQDIYASSSRDMAAEAFMNQIGQKVINILTNKTISDKERANQFREILENNFNTIAIGKFVLGKYWKNATPAEKNKFLYLFTESTVATYATRFKDYTSEKFEVLGSRQERDGGTTVLSQIVRPNGQPILINWKIFKKKGQLRIYDVFLEGISMGITQRNEYASVIQKGGGQIQALITALEQKLAASSK